MTEVLMAEEDWADLQITHPDVWHLIQTDTEFRALRTDLAQLELDKAKLDLDATPGSGTAFDDASDRRLTRIVRLGQRPQLDFFPDATARLEKARSILAKRAIELGRSGDLRPPIDLASQGRGNSVSTTATILDQWVSGKSPHRGDSLQDQGCRTATERMNGRDVIMVSDYSVFTVTNNDTTPLANAINPLNWKTTYNDFFKGMDGDGFVQLPNGSWSGVFEEWVTFQLTPSVPFDVKTVLRFHLYGDPKRYQKTQSLWDLPAMGYRLETDASGNPVGNDKTVLVDNGYAALNVRPDGSIELDSLKNVYFSNPVLNVASEYACSLWPAAIAKTISYTGSDLVEWPTGDAPATDGEPRRRRGYEARFTGLGTGAARPDVEDPPPESTIAAPTLPGSTPPSAALPADEPLEWMQAYTDAVASFMGRTTRSQMAYSQQLNDRWTGNQEVTLDRVADDSIEFFELNTDLVSEGAKLTVEWMERVARAMVAPQVGDAPPPDPPPDSRPKQATQKPPTGKETGNDG